MMKNETFLCAAASLLLFASCQAVLPPPDQAEGGTTGKAAVTIALTTGGERTVLPQVSLADVSRFTLSGAVSGGAAAELASFTSASGAQVFLEPGTWDFILNAYNGSDTLILQGSAESQNISLSGGNTITFTLLPLESGQGSISITVDCPTVIARVSASVDGGAESGANLTLTAAGSGKRAVYAETRSAGSYFIVLRFYDGDNTLRGVVSELAVVAGNLSSAKTLALAEGDLKAAAPPVVPPGIVVPEGGQIIHIGTQAELAAINDHLDDPAKNYGKNAYILDNDITLSGTWTPIGQPDSVDYNGQYPTGNRCFQGNFYGNGHRIHNLLLPGGGVHYNGLFGWAEDVTIRDLVVEVADSSITLTNSSGQFIGIIAAVAGTNSALINCGVYSSGGINVTNTGGYQRSVNIGGITVVASVSSCYAALNITADVNATHLMIGGVTLHTVQNSYFAGTINGKADNSNNFVSMGGVSLGAGSVQKSYAAGVLVNTNSGTSYSNTEGISAGTEENTASNSASLFSALTDNTASPARIWKSGTISSPTPAITNNYAFSGMTLNGSTVTSSDADSVQGLDKTAAQLKQRSTYETGLGWDFDTVWEMGPPSYPFPILQWQNGAVHIPQGFTVIED